jgi:transcriptional antiterminator RfaH
MNDWYLIRTKPKQEKIAIQNLQNQHFKTYCPMVKIKEKITPFFPGYIFLQSTEVQNIHPIRSTKGVLNIVRFGKEFARVKNIIIEELQSKEGGIAEKCIDMQQFHAGDKVEILEGVFKGNSAIFTEIDGENRAILLLKFIGRKHTLTIDKKNIVKF